MKNPQPRAAPTLGLMGQGCRPHFPAGVAWGPGWRAGPRSIPFGSAAVPSHGVIHLLTNWPSQHPCTRPRRGGLAFGPLSAPTASALCPSRALRVAWEAGEPRGQSGTRSWAASSLPDAREVTQLDRAPLLGVAGRDLGGLARCRYKCASLEESRGGHFLRAAVQNSLFLLRKQLLQLRSRPQACQLRTL